MVIRLGILDPIESSDRAFDEVNAVPVEGDGVVAKGRIGIESPERFAGCCIHRKQRFGLSQQRLHVSTPIHVAECDYMLGVSQRANQNPVLTRDESPCSGLTVGLQRSFEFFNQLAGDAINPQAAGFTSHVQAGIGDAVIAVSSRSAHQLIAVVRLENVGKRILPQKPAVVCIHAGEFVQPHRIQTTVIKQRPGTSTVTLRHLKFNVAEPEQTQRTFDQFVG